MTEKIEKKIERIDTGKSRLNKQRDMEILILVVFLTYLILYAYGMVPYIPGFLMNLLCSVGLFVALLLPSLTAFWLQGKSVKKLFTCVKGQGMVVLWLVVFRLLLALALHFLGVFKITPVLHPNFLYLAIQLVYYIVIVGVVEEFIFRIYIQGTLEEVLGKLSFLAPLLAGGMFGIFHAVNNGMDNAVLNIFVGAIWGYVRYFNKKATFTVMVLTHGLSDGILECLDILCGLMTKL